MSSNLLKMGFLQPQTEKRIIDTNALIAARLGTIREEMTQPENEGFTQGLKVEEIDVQALVGDQPVEHTAKLFSSSMTTEEAQSEAEKILQQAKEEAAQTLQDAIAQGTHEAENLKQQAWDAGFEEGKQACEKEYQERNGKLAQKERELMQKSKDLEAQYDAIVAELEPKMIDTLTGIYEHIFHVELGNYRDILIQLATDCMKASEGSKSFQVLVSPEDYAFVDSKKSRLVEAAGNGTVSVELIEDPGLSKNGCIIKTESGIMDCGLDTQLEELSRKIKILAYEKN